MWIYEKKLQYPARVDRTDIGMAKYLFAQFGGPDGELAAAVRYLSQRYTMPLDQTKGLLTDIGTEELAHWEIIATLIFKLTKGVPAKKLRELGLGDHYTQHDRALYPHDAAGVPWTAAYIQSIGDPVTDLHEDMAAEQKARTTYEHLINLTDDTGVKDTLRFLRMREVVHFQRFGEALRMVTEHQQCKKVY